MAELMRLAFPKATQFHAEYLAWLYAENPEGGVIGFNAWCDARLAGHYAVIPIRARLCGEVVRGALSVNTAVHPDHRGKGLFTRLAEQTYELARERGVGHVIGVANAASTHGFVRSLRFQTLGPLEACVLWRSPRLEAARGRPSWERVWESEDLRWRLRNPAMRYSVEHRKGCRLLLAPTGQAGIHCILKLEDEMEAIDLGSVELDARRRPGLRLWLGRGSRIVMSALGSASLPRRLRSSPLNVIFRSLERPDERIDGSSLEFQAIDFDAY
jgi:GNAT superfamily N-acetyltransferase